LPEASSTILKSRVGVCVVFERTRTPTSRVEESVTNREKSPFASVAPLARICDVFTSNTSTSASRTGRAMVPVKPDRP
jgi:hypothetical protein